VSGLGQITLNQNFEPLFLGAIFGCRWLKIRIQACRLTINESNIWRSRRTCSVRFGRRCYSRGTHKHHGLRTVVSLQIDTKYACAYLYERRALTAYRDLHRRSLSACNLPG
jgi:hypothetical protein